MRTRKELLLAIDEIIAEGDALRGRTNAAISARRKASLLDNVTFALGERARRNLKAIRILADHSMDDQVGSLARSLAEAAIDLEYLHVVTKRGDFELSPEIKAELFVTWKAIVKHDLPRDDSNAPEDSDYQRAIQLRRELGIIALNKEPGYQPGQFWSGASPYRQYKELQSAFAGTGSAGRMSGFRRFFQDFAFYAHTNPNDVPYVSVSPEGDRLLVSDRFEDDAILGAAAIPALDILRRWGLCLGETIEPRLLELLALVREPRGEHVSEI